MQRQALRDLPADKNPTGKRCIQITIPDDDEWEQAAYSELYRLALWMLWARDADKSAAPVAARWLKALDTWRHCDGSPSPITAAGDFEMSELCELLRWHEGKLQGWCCGEWTDIPSDGTAPIPGSGGQPDSGSRPAIGETQCFPVLLDASKQWLLPFGVNSGDTITISDIKGAWKNGATSGWTCTDGTPFVLGACIGAKYHLTGDPDPTLFHGQLAVIINGVYYSGTGGAFTVPGGVSNGVVTLVGNFEQTPGSGGEVTFKICVTNGGVAPVGTFCASLDFTLSTYGWVEDTREGVHSQWIPGQGWTNNNGGAADVTEIKFTLPSVRTITAATLKGFLTVPVGGGSGMALFCPVPATVLAGAIPNTGAFSLSGSTAQTSNVLSIGIQNNHTEGLYITGIIIQGTGDIPAGWTPC